MQSTASTEIPSAKRHCTALQVEKCASKTEGCKDWITWLAAMSPDAASEVWRRVFQNIVLSRVPHPLRFRNVLDKATYFWCVHRKERIELSTWYVRWLSMKHNKIEPDAWKVDWRIPQMQHWFVIHGLTGRSRKDDVFAVAQASNIPVRRSWKKAKIWVQLLRAGPIVVPRFKSYLVHTVENGQVVAHQRSV